MPQLPSNRAQSLPILFPTSLKPPFHPHSTYPLTDAVGHGHVLALWRGHRSVLGQRLRQRRHLRRLEKVQGDAELTLGRVQPPLGDAAPKGKALRRQIVGRVTVDEAQHGRKQLVQRPRGWLEGRIYRGLDQLVDELREVGPRDGIQSLGRRAQQQRAAQPVKVAAVGVHHRVALALLLEPLAHVVVVALLQRAQQHAPGGVALVGQRLVPEPRHGRRQQRPQVHRQQVVAQVRDEERIARIALPVFVGG